MECNYINDNGCPVVHFLECLTDKEKESELQALGRISKLYRLAVNKTKGYGKKYHNKRFGGGIAFYDDTTMVDYEHAMEAGLI